MSPQDAFFLRIENDTNHLHMASVVVFEGPAPSFDETVEMVASKLHLVPRYRQKVRFVPFELGRPIWTDDPHFNIEYHIRHTSLPRPGSDDQLRNLVGRVMSQQLDRAKPLWELWVTEGLGGGERWAILSKNHHCLVDGVSGTDLLSVVMDQSPSPRPAKPEAWRPEGEPSQLRLAADALRERVTSPYELLRGARSLLRGPRRVGRELLELGQDLSTFLHLLNEPPSSSLNGAIGPHRRWSWATSTLEDVKRIRRAHGGTVNDVVLSLVTRGFRDLLRSRGESLTQRVVRTLVPVSVRGEDEHGTYNNRVSAMFAELPVGIADPIERLESIRTQLAELKESHQAVAAETLTSLSGFAPPVLLALGSRLFARAQQTLVQTVTTNVPGPQQPLYAAGRRMLTARPYVPLLGSVRIGVAIFSYVGQLNFGVTGDYESAPDIGILCAGIEEGTAELLDVS
ncbi:MAG: wax ester/triacylglycerol synthase family O-acyltransferase [Myxococcota bacterium]